MMELTRGDILRADVEAIVNTVNCVGIMGRGIALQFKKAWPENFKAYEGACKRNEVVPGKMFIYETGQLTNPRYIINFPTKRHWRGASRIEDIELGLITLVKEIKRLKITSIAIPPLGAGLGGLDWMQVLPKIQAAVGVLPDVRVLIFEPKGAPENDKIIRKKKAPKMTAGRAVLIELMERYLTGLLDHSVTLLEVQKLLYFMQEAGEHLRLNYHKAHYGPYAENLRHVFNAVDGYYISGYADGGDSPNKQLYLVPGAVDEARSFLEKHPDTRNRFEQVSSLVKGFETSFGLELLATVHWLKKYEGIDKKEEIIQNVYSWNEHKKKFTPRQIEIAVKVLEHNSWLN